MEQIGVVAAALQEALVQNYDGLLRIAPAWPKEWDVDGTVYIQQKGKVDVQIRGGVLVTVVVEAGADGHMSVRNPWPGQRVEVVVSDTERHVAETGESTLQFRVSAGKSYLIQRVDSPNTKLRLAAVDGSPAVSPKSLGTRHIGLL